MEPNTAEAQLHLALGARIKQLRKARGVTQEQLAERVDAAPQTIRRIERGHTSPPLGRLLDIAGALGVELQELFRGIEASVPEPTWDTEQATIVELWDRTPEAVRPLLLDVMRAFTTRR